MYPLMYTFQQCCILNNIRRCRPNKAIFEAPGNKKLVLVLNKIDLVPRENVENWLTYLRKQLPTVAFKASTQSQKDHLVLIGLYI